MVRILCHEDPIYQISVVYTMSRLIEGKVYPYELEIGHSKSGSHQVLVIKSLKVKGDDLAHALEELHSAIKVFNLILNQDDN